MLKQTLQQKLLQKLSPQQIQLMKLLQVPTIAIEQRIKEELEGNPALEEGREEEVTDPYADDIDENKELSEAEQEFDFSEYMDDETPNYKLFSKNHGADADDKVIPFSVGTTFHEKLENQLGMHVLTAHQTALARHLIGSLDESGYLRRDLDAVMDDLAFTQNIMTTQEELLEILNVIQSFDPPGVGARDLKECLLLQLERKSDPTIEQITAKAILEECFDEFVKKHYDKICAKLEIEEDDLKYAIEEITKLNPKPGNSASDSFKPVEHIVPDFILQINDGEFELTLNQRNAPELKISRQYAEMMDHYSNIKGTPNRSEKEAAMFVKKKLDSAKWFIDAIRQRQETLLKTMNSILNYQRDYFLTGDETKLRPMILKDIAEIIQMDISTVSRVANSKYITTPYGTFLLKSFFSESLTTTSGEEVSTREVKKILNDLIEEENKKKPLTDERLAKDLKGRGYNIARRTVAKYREQLNIPVARLRKEI